jgi:hypothetical protein
VKKGVSNEPSMAASGGYMTLDDLTGHNEVPLLQDRSKLRVDPRKSGTEESPANPGEHLHALRFVDVGVRVTLFQGHGVHNPTAPLTGE